jgi:Spy/CpxP family protein refolding chaperone
MGQMPMMGMGMMGQEGMNMMGQMPGMGSMQMPSALPGFPGASHIYHIGATGFFLDHPQHMALTQEQQSKLNQIKEKALSGQATSDRWIAQGEQEIWTLTSSDSPDVSKIEAKVREIEKLRSDKRMAFIRAVGEAAMVLTDEQRQTLTGHANHQSAPSTPQ